MKDENGNDMKKKQYKIILDVQVSSDYISEEEF
jgi:hypothetical protein